MFYSKGNLRPEKEPLCISVKQHYSVSAFFLLESVVLDLDYIFESAISNDLLGLQMLFWYIQLYDTKKESSRGRFLGN